MTLQQRVPLLRDLTCLSIGAAGFVWSLATGADWKALVMSAALMAGPGVLQLVLAGFTPGGALSQVSASPEPPPPSGSPSSAQSGVDR